MSHGRALACALAVVAVAGCSRPQPLRIGFVSGLTGRHYDLGVSSRNGVSLALAELNAAGGIGGRPLELLVRDDQQDPAAARAAVEELIDAGVVAIVGHATSSMARVTLPIVDARRVLMISPTVSSSAFEGKDDFFVMLNPSTAAAARTVTEHVLSRGLRRFAAVYDLSNEAYTRSWHDHFAEALRAGGGELVRSVPFTSGLVASYAELVSGLGRGVDAVAVIANALDSATIAQQLRKTSKVQIVCTDWGFTKDVVKHGGSAVEGALFTQKVNVHDRSPAFLRFKEAYEGRFNREVDFAAILSYEAVLVLADALRRDATREGVRRALLDIGRFDGVHGPVAVDRFGDAQRPVYVMTVRDGKMSFVE